jgi:hypothetical protein
MANGDRPVHLTRGEFYAAMVLVWLYITLALGKLVWLKNEGWTTGLLFVVPVVMTLSYIAMGFRAGETSAGAGRAPGPGAPADPRRQPGPDR